VIFGLVQDAIQAHGTLAVDLPVGPPFFRYSDHGVSREALVAAGFVQPEVAEVPLSWQLESVDELLLSMEGGTVRSRGLLLAQAPAALEKIRKAIAAAVQPYADGEGRLQLPQPMVVATARKP
jgi:hypothetical protein